MRLRGSVSRLLAAFRRVASGPDGGWAFHHAAGIKAYAQGNYRGAERQFLTALRLAEIAGTIHEHSASSLNNLSLVYKRQRKLRKAETCFRRALQIYEVTAPGSVQYARTLYHLATLYHAKKEYTEAESLYQRCIVLTQRTLGESHPKLAKRLEAYARLLRHTNRDERAAQMKARATAIRALHNRNVMV
jgi:tetratricopeptide (TPR) repeat protein